MVKAGLSNLAFPGLGKTFGVKFATGSPSQKTIVVLVVHNKGLLY